MKIILTPSEASDIILEHFAKQNLPATYVEIQTPFDSKPKPCEMAAWARARAFRNQNKMENWISSIKRLRADTGLSLGDARTAIELPYESVLAYFANTGTLAGIFSHR